MTRSSIEMIHGTDTSYTTESHHVHKTNAAVDENDDSDDDNDDDWIIQQAEVWAATNKETKSNAKTESTEQKRSISISKVSPNCNIESSRKDQVERAKSKNTKKRKLPSLNDTGTSVTTSFNNEPLPSSQQQQQQQGPQLYSLHLTQLSYDATDFDIREHFIRHGCMNIPSIRLVYDHQDTAKSDGWKQKKFRGVAFVDIYMDTYESYETLIQQLHGSTMLQRKINVRPVKSKVELASIVQQTKLYVNQQIQMEKEKKKMKQNASAVTDNAATNGVAKKKFHTESKTKQQKKKSAKSLDLKQQKLHKSSSTSSGSVDVNMDPTRASGPSLNPKKRNRESSMTNPQEKTTLSVVVKKVKHVNDKVTTSTNTTTGSSTSSKKGNTTTSTSANTTKLTKQQRNRKAAILMQRRRTTK